MIHNKQTNKDSTLQQVFSVFPHMSKTAISVDLPIFIGTIFEQVDSNAISDEYIHICNKIAPLTHTTQFFFFDNYFLHNSQWADFELEFGQFIVSQLGNHHEELVQTRITLRQVPSQSIQEQVVSMRYVVAMCRRRHQV